MYIPFKKCSKGYPRTHQGLDAPAFQCLTLSDVRSQNLKHCSSLQTIQKIIGRVHDRKLIYEQSMPHCHITTPYAQCQTKYHVICNLTAHLCRPSRFTNLNCGRDSNIVKPLHHLLSFAPGSCEDPDTIKEGSEEIVCSKIFVQHKNLRESRIAANASVVLLSVFELNI